MENITNLPINHFPLQDLELERTDLFVNYKSREIENLNIVIGFRDPGEAAALLPVIEKLATYPINLSIFADSRAKEALRASGSTFTSFVTADTLLRIADYTSDADVIFTGFSNSPGTELALTANGLINDVPTVWIEDYPGSIFDHYRNKRKTVAWIKPDYLCVVSEFCKKQELQNEPSFDPDKIIVTGQPAHDRFSIENRVEIKNRVRQDLGLTDETKLITYMGVPQLASAEALKLLLEGLSNLNLTDYKFVLRRHPRDTTQPTEYQSLMRSITDKIIDTGQFKTDEVGIASDLIVTTMSSTGTDAVYRGIPSIHILNPNILANSEVGACFTTPELVTTGASVGVFKENEILPALENIFFNLSFRKHLEEIMDRFKPVAGSADRVAQFILQLATEHKK